MELTAGERIFIKRMRKKAKIDCPLGRFFKKYIYENDGKLIGTAKYFFKVKAINFVLKFILKGG